MKNLLILAILGALLTVGLSHPSPHKDDSFNSNPLSHGPRPPMPPPDFVDFGENAEFESDSSDFSDDLEGERPPLPPQFNDNGKENGEFLPPPPGHHGERPPFGRHHGKHPRFRGPREEEEGSNIAKNKESLKEVDIEGSFEHLRPPHYPHKFNKSEGPHKHGHGKRHGGFNNKQRGDDERRGPGDRKGPHHKGHKGHGKPHKRFARKPEETSFNDIARGEKLIQVVPVEKL